MSSIGSAFLPITALTPGVATPLAPIHSPPSSVVVSETQIPKQTATEKNHCERPCAFGTGCRRSYSTCTACIGSTLPGHSTGSGLTHHGRGLWTHLGWLATSCSYLSSVCLYNRSEAS